MADGRRPPARTHEDPKNLLQCLHWRLSLVAKFTMRPWHSAEYRELVFQFDAQNIPYEAFRLEMNWLLQPSEYAHLRVYWDVFHRVIMGEEQTTLDNCNPLFLYPFILHDLCILFLHMYSARFMDPLWSPVPRPESTRASQIELSRIRSRRHRRAGGDRILNLDPSVKPEWTLTSYLNFFQNWMALNVLRQEDYNCYAGLSLDYSHGHLPHDEFMEKMGLLLRSRNYEVLRLWWHIHRMDVCGVRRMVDNPFLRPAVAVFAMLYIVHYLAGYRDILWKLFLKAVRGRQRVDSFETWSSPE